MLEAYTNVKIRYVSKDRTCKSMQVRSTYTKFVILTLTMHPSRGPLCINSASSFSVSPSLVISLARFGLDSLDDFEALPTLFRAEADLLLDIFQNFLLESEEINISSRYYKQEKQSNGSRSELRITVKGNKQGSGDLKAKANILCFAVSSFNVKKNKQTKNKTKQNSPFFSFPATPPGISISHHQDSQDPSVEPRGLVAGGAPSIYLYDTALLHWVCTVVCIIKTLAVPTI